MDSLLFRVVAAEDGGWAFEHDGQRSMSYRTREAAFEAIVGPVSNAIKEGEPIAIDIDAPAPGKPVIEPSTVD